MLLSCFKKLVNLETIKVKVIQGVDSQEHVQYFMSRRESWSHIKESSNDELVTLLKMGVEEYADIYLSCSAKSDRYGQFLFNWYNYVVLSTAASQDHSCLLDHEY